MHNEQRVIAGTDCCRFGTRDRNGLENRNPRLLSIMAHRVNFWGERVVFDTEFLYIF